MHKRTDDITDALRMAIATTVKNTITHGMKKLSSKRFMFLKKNQSINQFECVENSHCFLLIIFLMDADEMHKMSFDSLDIATGTRAFDPQQCRQLLHLTAHDGRHQLNVAKDKRK